MSLRRSITYAGGALAAVSALAGIVSWWLPSSATWLDRHGFAAWPVAIFSLLLLIWAAVNWRQTARELAIVRAQLRVPVPADRQLFVLIKKELPKDSSLFSWLRYDADTRLYSRSSITPLRDFIAVWRDTDYHFVDPELERAAQAFVANAVDFFSYQASHSYRASQRLQIREDDPVFQYFSSNDGDDRKRRELTKELGERANKVLSAYDELYMTGSRLGL